MRDETRETGVLDTWLADLLAVIFLVYLLFSFGDNDPDVVVWPDDPDMVVWPEVPDIQGDGTSADSGEAAPTAIPWRSHPKLPGS